MSKSEEYLNKRSQIPTVTNNMVKSVSDYRRASLESETSKGLYKDGKVIGTGAGNNSSQLSVYRQQMLQTSPDNSISAAGNLVGLSKKADTQPLNSGWAGAGTVEYQSPDIYSPLWLNSNLSLPRDRATVNAWSRSFFALNPIVHNAINLHATYPISSLNIKCKDKKIEQEFMDMIEDIELENVCAQISQEYWLLGEAFVYAQLDEVNFKWERLVIQNPDYITVKRSVIQSEPLIMLKPDENLKRLVKSNNPRDVEDRKLLNDNIIQCVKRGENIPLDNFYISHLARRISPYEIRGTGLPVTIFRHLMLMDKYRECDYAQADNMVNPLTIVKIGSGDYKPTPADLEHWKDIFAQGQYDKDFKIFTHEGVTIERVGAGSGIYDTTAKLQQIIKEIYAGLLVPSTVIDGGVDITYANAGVSVDVLRQRYMTFRNMMRQWLRRKIFTPIAKLRGYYEFSNKAKNLIVPDIDWNHMSLFDTNDHIQSLVGLLDKKASSLQTVYRSLGLDYEEEKRKMRQERIQAAIVAKEEESLKQIPLNELRALTDDKEIPELTPAPLPGEDPSSIGGGISSPSGGDSGGMPPLPGMDSGSPPPPPSMPM